MKEIRNLAEKNDCFGKVDYIKIIDEMMKKTLPLLMLMVAKRDGYVKTKGVEMVSYKYCMQVN